MKNRHLILITLHADPATPSGTAEGGGTHSYVRELMVGLAKTNWSLTVLTRWADSRLPEREMVSPSVRIVRLRINGVGPIDKRLLDDLHEVSLTEARAILVTEPKVDLLHSVYWNSGRVAMDLSDQFGLPFVHTVISNGWRRWHQGAQDQPPSRLEIEKQVFASAFAIFCVSGQERADLVEHYAVDPNKIVVVGRPVAFSFQHPCRDEWGTPLGPHWSEAYP
jgi:glycosyltransferase involved in cell wall biosynthesis